MAEVTEISWAHSTFNPWIGCARVSPGCDNCYAATLMDERYGRVKWGAGEARSRTKTWDQPRRWTKLAAASGKPRRVFCSSLADVFDNEVDPAWRDDLYELIGQTPALTWMLLTKRIGNAPRIRWPKHVWIGATIVNQEEADRDIPKLMQVDANVRFLSCEPLLGPLNLTPYLRDVHWVIVGGESGHGARKMEPDWPLSIRDQCEGFKVPFHFKQWGPRNVPALLDGVEHRAFPL